MSKFRLVRTSRNIKEAVYTTFIRPTVEYAAIAWDPHTQRSCDKVERVQRCAARYVMGDFSRRSSVTSMLHSLNWQSLQRRRLHSRLAMVYKIRSGLVDITWHDYFAERPPLHSTRGHSSRLQTIQCNTSVYAGSFFPRSARDWNRLPFDPDTSASLDDFKSTLREVCL